MENIYWDPNDNPTNSTLSMDNKKSTINGDGFIKINKFFTTGKWYIEFINEYVQYLMFIGFVRKSFNKNQSFGSSWVPGSGRNYGGYDDRFGIMVAPNQYYPGAYSILNSQYTNLGDTPKTPNNQIIGILWDIENSHLEYRINNNYLIDFNYPIEFKNEEMYFGFGGHVSNRGIIRTNKNEFSYSIPEGYYQLDPNLSITSINYSIISEE